MPEKYNLYLNKMMFMSLNSHMTSVTSGAGTANHSGAPEFIPVLSKDRVPQLLVFYIVLC